MMRLPDIRRVGQMLVIALAWCIWPTSAQAQAYPCSGGGPGERVVGMTQGGNGIAPVPLCVRDGPAPPPAAPNDSYAAIAWHPNAADIWADGNYLYAGNVSEGEALAACNRVMGDGCTLAGTWWNSSMAIVRDRSGYFYKAWAGNGGAERRQVIAECSAKQLLPCEVFATISSSTRRRSPGPSARKSFGAAAWVAGNDGYDHRLYVASGYRSADEAATAAIKACSDATSRPCENHAVSGNGFIQAFRIHGKNDSATVETSAKRAQAAARLHCKKQKSASCELQAVFDSRKPGLFVHQFVKAEAP